MKLTVATWNILSGGTDADSDARLRRQMELPAGPGLSVVTSQFSGRRAHCDVSGLLYRVADMSATSPDRGTMTAPPEES